MRLLFSVSLLSCLSLLLLNSSPAGVSGLHLVSQRRHEQGALEQISVVDRISADVDTSSSSSLNMLNIGKIQKDARIAFCGHFGAGIGDAGTVLIKHTESMKKPFDIFWMPQAQDDIPECKHGAIPADSVPGCTRGVCVVTGAVDLLGSPHIHFADYSPAAGTSVLRLSLKDTCTADDNYHHPADVTPRTAAASARLHRFNGGTTCTRAGVTAAKQGYRTTTITKWNAMFGQ